ncbi:MAG: transcriptional regulator, HxlR family [Anaerospora sp.]|nr:transcriptional regulator, HxlR family [Anaerospora sp.]
MEEIKICPIEAAVNLIGHKWKVLILRNLLNTNHQRFLITRKIYAEVPPKVEYSLTELGWSLQPILESISLWGKDYLTKQGKSLDDLVDD